MNKFIVAIAAVSALAFTGVVQAHGYGHGYGYGHHHGHGHSRGSGRGARDALVGAAVGAIIVGAIMESKERRREPEVIVLPPRKEGMDCYLVPSYDHNGRSVYIERCYPSR